jgi:tRNA(adenine34) deaminase
MSGPNYLKRALELARQAASEDEVPVGAVVVYRGQSQNHAGDGGADVELTKEVMVGQGYNTREQDQNPLKHAELIAIEQASKTLGSWRLLDCDLYVTLEPCPMCLSACQQARVRRVIYGARDEKGGAICLGYHIHQDPKVNHRFEVIYQEDPECSAVLSEFFSNKRKLKK